MVCDVIAVTMQCGKLEEAGKSSRKGDGGGGDEEVWASSTFLRRSGEEVKQTDHYCDNNPVALVQVSSGWQQAARHPPTKVLL